MAIKDARKESPPTAYMSLVGREYRLPCLLPYQVPTTPSTTSPRHLGNYSPISKHRSSPHLGSSSMRMLDLTPQSSDARVRSTRYSQTWLQTPWRGRKEDDTFFDELLYGQRYCIERTNAWMDSYRSLLNRFDTKQTSWVAWNYLVFMVILLKMVKRKKKSR